MKFVVHFATRVREKDCCAKQGLDKGSDGSELRTGRLFGDRNIRGTMPDASVSSLVYKLATLQKKKKDQEDVEQNNTVVSQGWLPREPSPALLESNILASANNKKADSFGTFAYNSEKKRRSTIVDLESPSNFAEQASYSVIPVPSANYGTSWFMNICESCGAAHDGLYGSGRFCSKHCAKGVGARCKWNMVKGNTSHAKDTYQYSSEPNTERKATDFGKRLEDMKTVKSGDPLHRLCILAENEKILLASENESKPEMETKQKKRLYKYQLWLLEQQRNCNVVDNLEQGTDSFAAGMNDSQVTKKETSLEEVFLSKASQWNEIPVSSSGISGTSSFEELPNETFQERSHFSVENLLNEPSDSKCSPFTSIHDKQCRLPPFTTLEKAAEQGDREFALRKWYHR